MKRLLFYSHDSYGLGNIRRTLSICHALSEHFPKLMILIISGSPMIHKFPMPARVDYIRLPCPTRNGDQEETLRPSNDENDDLLKLRSELILTATINFKPDIVLVNRRPSGVKRELESTLKYVRECSPNTKIVLLLRDILDNAENTRQAWEDRGYHDVIRTFYDQILVLGQPDVFDPRDEYAFPITVSEKVEFCGYIRREHALKTRTDMRNELGLSQDNRLVLVTAGGGGDGYRIMETYISMLKDIPNMPNMKSLILTGPEMPDHQKAQLRHLTLKIPRIVVSEFASDMMSYMNAADVVVSMGGYGTVCEILSLRKSAIVIPRAKPLEEQWIRATRMAELGMFTVIHPDELTPQILGQTIQEKLAGHELGCQAASLLNLDALPKIAQLFSHLLNREYAETTKPSIF